MSKIKQICSEKFSGTQTVKFKAEAQKAVFILEKQDNISGISLFLVSNRQRIYMGSVWDSLSVAVTEKELLPGENYELEIKQYGVLEDSSKPDSKVKQAEFQFGIFWKV